MTTKRKPRAATRAARLLRARSLLAAAKTAREWKKKKHGKCATQNGWFHCGHWPDKFDPYRRLPRNAAPGHG